MEVANRSVNYNVSYKIYNTMKFIQTMIFAILSPIVLLMFGIFMVVKRTIEPREQVVPVRVYRTVSGKVVIRHNAADFRRLR